jgi:predicted metal-dependent hydrolase
LKTHGKEPKSSIPGCMKIEDIMVEIVRKKVKHINLSVHPPDGRVRISAPRSCRNENLLQFVSSKMDWIRKQQEKIKSRPVRPEAKFVTGERHWHNGIPYLLHVLEGSRAGVEPGVDQSLLLTVKTGFTKEQREKLLTEWYRSELKERIPSLLSKWEVTTGLKVNDWGVKQMKTRWGTCNIRDKRIWINLQVAKYPQECLEYIILHELMHLEEKYHNARFYSLLDHYMPGWQDHRRKLKENTLG